MLCTHGCGRGFELFRSALKLLMLLESCARRASVCSTDRNSSSPRPSVAIFPSNQVGIGRDASTEVRTRQASRMLAVEQKVKPLERDVLGAWL